MKMEKTVHCATRQEWREWLANFGAQEKEVWLVFDRVGGGQPVLAYDDAVEEGLCYGWIDSIIQRIDEAHYARKFNPRTNWERWSESNILRMRKLVAAGQVMDWVLAKLPGYVLEGEVAHRARPSEKEIPEWISAALQAHEPAWSNFEGLSPSNRRLYLGWILDAKREETRLRRLEEAIQRLLKNLPLGLSKVN
jgi:uncharacterized protein YdeI (YjbR/CyaY-like superfamily)